MKVITSREIMILRRLREKLNGSDAELLENVINETLARNDVQRVCELINNEFLMKGIEEDYEPNEYGRELENLLDKVNAPRLS
jgi:hypothetical protein